ncbi:hypothetical protein C2G38_2220738 [Gigaspora rosea]|uniref:Uncharacterized protein n=1 Tax=Gigaspora rosea TaxID=44941 RepID=A0A397U437_9GLOM|nr:hypothetical protein C2G38_2220738 [Gigaspora rosea]
MLDKSLDTHVLHDIYQVAFNDKSIGPINIIDYSIISDYIIKNDDNYLLIQKLSQNDIWIEYLKHKEHHYESGFSLDYGSILEIKVLKNGDILLVCQLSILIYTIEHSEEDFKIKLIYCWFNEPEYKFEMSKLPKNSIINFLTSFKNNLIYNYGSEILLSPTPFAITYKSTSQIAYQVLKWKNSTLLKFYGKDIFKFILKNDGSLYLIDELLDYCYDQSLSMLKKEEFLSKTNMLIGHPNDYHYNQDFLFISLFALFAIYPQETVRLMIPSLGFATYSKNYSYSKLFYLQGNPFTSLLDASDYYKWWNIKALISFKWNTYGRLYYFLLEIKFLLFFRILDYFGTYFAIMIGVAQKVFSFLVVLGILVLAFAHSLHLLLRPKSEYSYDQPSFTDDANNPWN